MQGIDYNQYGSWESIQAPTGQMYYKVPGTGYVYDPFLSAIKGRPILWTNPEPQVAEKQKQEDRIQAAEDRAEYQASPEGQLIPVAGGVAGTVGAAYLVDQFKGPNVAGVVDDKIVLSDGSIKPISGAATVDPSVAGVGGGGGSGVAGGGGGYAPDLSGAGQSVAAQTVIPAGQPIPDGVQIIGSDGFGGTIVEPISSGSFGPSQVPQTPSEGFLSGFNGADLAQGAAGAAQIYQGYQNYKDGDTLGAGINTASGAAMVGSALGSEWAASAVPYLGPAAGAYGLYKMDDFVGDAPAGGRRNTNAAIMGATSGAAIGTGILPGVGTAIGAGVGALYGALNSYFGSSKDKYQKMRDAGRAVLKENGILNDDWQGTLADGSTFDFGKDGKGQTKLDYDDPVTGRVIGLGNVIAAGEGAAGRSTEAMSMLYTGGALSNAGGDYEKARQNMLHFARQRGMTPQNLLDQLARMRDEGAIDQGQFEAYQSGVNELFRAGEAPVSPASTGTPPQQQQPAPQPAPQQSQGEVPRAEPAKVDGNTVLPPGFQNGEQPKKQKALPITNTGMKLNDMAVMLAKRMDERAAA